MFHPYPEKIFPFISTHPKTKISQSASQPLVLFLHIHNFLFLFFIFHFYFWVLATYRIPKINNNNNNNNKWCLTKKKGKKSQNIHIHISTVFSPSGWNQSKATSNKQSFSSLWWLWLPYLHLQLRSSASQTRRSTLQSLSLSGARHSFLSLLPIPIPFAAASTPPPPTTTTTPPAAAETTADGTRCCTTSSRTPSSNSIPSSTPSWKTTPPPPMPRRRRRVAVVRQKKEVVKRENGIGIGGGNISRRSTSRSVFSPFSRYARMVIYIEIDVDVFLDSWKKDVILIFGVCQGKKRGFFLVKNLFLVDSSFLCNMKRGLVMNWAPAKILKLEFSKALIFGVQVMMLFCNPLPPSLFSSGIL